jgi:hypothetical protein
MSLLFDHEKLEVHQASLSFIAWLEPVLIKANSGNAGYRDTGYRTEGRQNEESLTERTRWCRCSPVTRYQGPRQHIQAKKTNHERSTITGRNA